MAQLPDRPANSLLGKRERAGFEHRVQLFSSVEEFVEVAGGDGAAQPNGFGEVEEEPARDARAFAA